MPSPSEPLLQLLRKLAQARGLNTAALAARTGLDRARVRRVLSGAEPMLVDELLVLGELLDVKPEDLNLPEAAASGPGLSLADDSDDLQLEPLGNHAEQLFQVAFGLGCDFTFVADVSELEGSGVPEALLEQYADRGLMIRLDAAYHSYNQPRYSPTGITLTLSFDSLRDCFFPWQAIQQVTFLPAPPDLPEDEPSEERPSGGPVLRLVT